MFFVMKNLGFCKLQNGRPGSTEVGYAVRRRTIPCSSNCWAGPRGLQKIVYFDWGSTYRKVWEPLC